MILDSTNIIETVHMCTVKADYVHMYTLTLETATAVAIL